MLAIASSSLMPCSGKDKARDKHDPASAPCPQSTVHLAGQRQRVMRAPVIRAAKAMVPLRLVAARAIFTAFSTAQNLW